MCLAAYRDSATACDSELGFIGFHADGHSVDTSGVTTGFLLFGHSPFGVPHHPGMWSGPGNGSKH